MSELIIFCNPGTSYKGKLEENVAKDYFNMTINDYDNLISFDEEYLPLVETLDYESIVGSKEGRKLFLTLFTEQPMIKVGDIDEEFISSSYLFNPELTDKLSEQSEELLLPDLDIVQLEGDYRLSDAANTIKNFYEKYGWQTYIFDGQIDKNMKVETMSDRFNQPIKIIDPEILKKIAKEKVGYNPTKLCF